MVASDAAESHPDSGELTRLVHGSLEKSRAKDAIKHLLRGCAQCAAQVAPEAELLLPHKTSRSAPPIGDGTEYEPPIERAFDKARRHWHALMTGEALPESELASVPGEPAAWADIYNLIDIAVLKACFTEAKRIQRALVP